MRFHPTIPVAVVLLACAAVPVRAGDVPKPVVSNYADLFAPDRVCPVSGSREKLLYLGGKTPREIREGTRLLLDVDSHPRQPARLVKGPEARKAGGGWEISFALDRPDDVDVRIVDGAGAMVRRLGCGVLGSNAPAPFARDSPAQTIPWDGLDADGNAAPAGCRVVVSVGLQPRFERFVGYDRGSVVPDITALEVDPTGRVYVAMSVPENRGDVVVLRFARDGSYADMAYPGGPARLGDRALEDLYKHTEYIEGRAMPTRPRSWSYYIWQWPTGSMFPLAIDRAGKGYIAEILTGWGSADVDWATTHYRIFDVGDLDRFWFLQNISVRSSYAGMALDGKGFAYLAAKTFPDKKGAGVSDHAGLGTIRKVNAATGQPQPDFTWNGTTQREAPSAYLGTPPAKGAKAPNRYASTTDNAAVDAEDRFVDIAGIEIDTGGRILVADSKPRRVKVYGPDGEFAGMLQGIAADGNERRFRDIRSIRSAGEYIYMIASFERHKPLLLKLSGDILSPALVWQTPVHQDAAYLAVDTHAEPPLLWFANGSGPGTFSCVADRGDAAGDASHFGGTKERCFRFPMSIAAGPGGRLYVHDTVRKALICTDDETSAWKEVKGPPLYATLFADTANGRLYASTPGKPPACYTPDLEPLKDFSLKGSGKSLWSAKGPGPIAGLDREGTIYVTDSRPGKRTTRSSGGGKNDPDLRGAIRRFGPDGTEREGEFALLNWGGGDLAVDSHGAVYVMDCAGADIWTHVSHNIPCGLNREKKDFSDGIGPARLMYRRGNYPVWHQSDICYLVKFGPQGGVRNTDTELWAHRGVSPHSAGGCSCDWPRGIVTVDAADRIYAADGVHHHVKVFDTAGNLTARIGWWGNAENVPDDGDASKLGLWNIYGLTARDDALYVCDKDLRRISKFVMTYRQTAEAPLE